MPFDPSLLLALWGVPALAFSIATHLAYLGVRQAKDGSRLPWIAHVHPMVFMQKTGRAGTEGISVGRYLAWQFVALCPVVNVIQAVLYLAVLRFEGAKKAA